MRLDVQPENIPDRLRALPRWGGWKLESTADGKPTKVPYRADRPDELASSTDPSTWGDFETALAAYRAGQIDGIGFRLGEGITGLDIDHCISAGVLEPKARHCLDVLQSYSELSQSGTGIHTIVYGEKPGHRCKHNGFELYSHGRYFCMTGRRLRDYPASVEERSAELATLYHEIFGPDPEPAASSAPSSGSPLSDAEVLAVAMRATNGDRFAALWTGDTSRYHGDESAADLALCNLLAFYTGRDTSQMDRLFRSSGLMRAKWDTRRNQSTYGADTMAKAIAGCRETYTVPIDIELETDEAQTETAADRIAETAWPSLSDDALIGLFGDYVHALSPHTEADPVGLLVHALVLFGNLIGRRAQVAVGDDLHYLNENALIIGDTSTGRKGMALNAAKALLADVDPDWMTTRVMAGLSSGEGLIYHVRDPLLSGEDEIEDPGVADKRLTIVETEFAKVLRVSRRENNTLSTILRQCWDDGTLRVMTRNSPLTATGAHVSVVGHITPLELRQELKTTDMASGFINRFILVLVKRRQLLPVGGRLDGTERARLVAAFTARARQARESDVLTRDAGALAHWSDVYGHLTRSRLGLVGAICNRAPAHVLRLSALYALADGTTTIQRAHQQAALAVWRYAEASTAFIFGQRVGHRLANFLIEELRSRPAGMTRTEIRDLFARNRPADEIGEALQLLHDLGLASCRKEPGSGRPVERWTVEGTT